MVTIIMAYLSKELCTLYVDRGQAGEHYVLLGNIRRAAAITELQITLITILVSGLGSLVGIATDYGLDGPRSNPGGDEISHASRPALGPTQPPVKWIPGLSRE